MQVTVEDAGTLRKQVTINCDAAEVSARADQMLDRYAGQMSMKGFRKGKAPRGVLKKRFGKAVENEAHEALVQEGMRQAMDENGLQPIGPMANDEFSTDDGLKHVTSFDIRPAIDLPDPAKLSVTIETCEADDAEVQEEIDSLLRRSGNHADLGEDDELAKDDVVRLTGKISSGEETVREVHDLNHIIGAYPLFGKEAEDIVKATEGQKIGAELAFDTTLPDNFKPEEWAGKEAQVSVTVQSAQRMQPAELNDDFAKRLGADSVDALRERVIEMITGRKENELHSKQVDELIDGLIAATSFDVPPKLFGDVIEDNLRRAVAQAKQQAGEEADSVDEDAIRKEQEGDVAKNVERDLRRLLLLDAIAEANQVQATQEDLQQQIVMAAYQSGRKPEELAKQLQESGRIMEVANDIRQHKALELMLQKVVEANGPASDETAEADQPKTKPKAKKKAVTKKKAKADETAEAEANQADDADGGAE